MNDQWLENTRKHQSLLDDLLNAPAIKYSTWPTASTERIKNSSGVYHFYKIDNDCLISLYVGKASISENNWNLYKRLCQHFQISQKHALLGKAAEKIGKSPAEIKEEYMNTDVFLQWLPISNEMPEPEFKRELIWIECFCKSILKPIYTDL